VRQVGYLKELYEDERSEKILNFGTFLIELTTH